MATMRPAVVWVSIIVGLLAMSVIGHAVLLISAVCDPSFAIEPDYEQKAAEVFKKKTAQTPKSVIEEAKRRLKDYDNA